MFESQPTVIVLFGVSGDLAGRKILPALYHLIKDGLLPNDCKIIGTTRQSLTKEQLLKNTELCVLETDNVCNPDALKKFNDIFELFQLDPVKDEDYLKLKQFLNKLEASEGKCFNRLFYLSIPPQLYMPIVERLGKHGLAESCEHGKAKSRLLVEKPFGYDLASAKELISETAKYFKEEQVFRIDHYLAKETAQNILIFRKHNPLLKDVWNNKLIRQIHIRALENIGIEGRKSYDSIGALRDVIQSHLVQLMAISTMDIPGDINSSKEIHEQKIKLLNQTSLVVEEGSWWRGQYDSYRQEIGDNNSNTETYIKLNLQIDNDTWRGVKIVLETGKALKTKVTDISIDFSESNDKNQNQLTIRIQPNEGINIKLFVKEPGIENKIDEAAMDFSYQQTFGVSAHPDAYERVIVDAIRGDQSLFASSKEVIRSWEILEPIIESLEKDSSGIEIYSAGSDGPDLS